MKLFTFFFFIKCVGVVKAAEMGVPCSPKLPCTSWCSFGLKGAPTSSLSHILFLCLYQIKAFSNFLSLDISVFHENLVHKFIFGQVMKRKS